MQIRSLTPGDDAALAALIRKNLKAYGLDIPGTAYYDEALDRLSAYYAHSGRAYFVLAENEKPVGGIGLAEISLFPRCCEMQKLYLDDAVKGHGLGYRLIETAEQAARRLGYGRMYLETHTRLQAAIHLYEKCGYREIPRPSGAVHSAMNKFYLKVLLPEED